MHVSLGYLYSAEWNGGMEWNSGMFNLIYGNIIITIKFLIIRTSAQLYVLSSRLWKGRREVWRVDKLAAVTITNATLTIP